MSLRTTADAGPEWVDPARQPARGGERPFDKGLYYSEAPDDSNVLVAFYMACDRFLERKPFLMMDFRSNEFFLDGDRDGCVDAAGTLPLPEIDPADFLPAVDGAEDLCSEDLLGYHRLNGLAAVPE